MKDNDPTMPAYTEDESPRPVPKRELLIVTGPPGAGKSTYVKKLDLPTFDQNLGNKSMLRDSKEPIQVLVTSAPGRRAKDHWIKEAKRFGFTPSLFVVDPGRAVCVQRLLTREMETTEGQRRRLSKSVQRWYNDYETHVDETRLEL